MIYRRVLGYYGGGPKEPDEDAFGEFPSLIEICLSLKLLLDLTRLLSDLADMRKALLIDKDKESIKLPKGIKSGRDWGVGPEEIVF